MDIIAIIDDDEAVRVATVDLLNSVGLACEAFATAKAYLAAGRAGRTACLVLDVSMPDMDGLELQRRLAANGFAVPIVFITAFPTDAIRSRAMKAGAVCFLPKPYPDGELLRCVQHAIRHGKTADDERGPEA